MNLRRIACVALPLCFFIMPTSIQAQDQGIPWEVTEAIIEKGQGAKRELLLEWSQGQGDKQITEDADETEVDQTDPVVKHESEALIVPPKQTRKRAKAPQGYSCFTPWRIALTFDDGPFPHHTPVILDILLEKQAKATFFLVGQQIKAYPSIVRRIYDEGHEIALHTHSHPDMSKISEDDQRLEMDKSRYSLERALPGVTPVWWRAPYGVLTDFGLRAGKSMGMRHLGWTIDTQDWRRPTTSQFLDTVVRRARDGDVVLMHDHARTTRLALAALIDELHHSGFEMRTVSELDQPGCPRIAESESEEEPHSLPVEG